MGVRIINSDVLEGLRQLPDESVHCVVTSPPYWGLRDYGTATWVGGYPECEHRSPTMRDGRAGCAKCGAVKVDQQLGLEPTLAEHIETMVAVFREVRRVLRKDGTLWLNYGDCYATSVNGRSAADTKSLGNDDRTFRDKPFSTVGPIYDPNREAGDRRGGPCKQRSNRGSNHTGRICAGGMLKPKDLCMAPNRLAIALQDDGWWVRSEIIWAKPNGMPDSSGRFRPSTSHEKIFLLAKSDEVEWWLARDTGEISADPDLSEKCTLITTGKLGQRWIGLGHYYDAAAVKLAASEASESRAQDIEGQIGSTRANGGRKTNGTMKSVGGPRKDKQRGHSRRHAGLNDRWDQIDKKEQCANGRLLRNYEPAPLPVWNIATKPFSEAHFATFPPELAERCIKAGCPKGGTVLDPFAGTGTTGLVADRLGRDAILIELNPEYAAMAERRIMGDAPLFTEVSGFTSIGTAAHSVVGKLHAKMGERDAS